MTKKMKRMYESMNQPSPIKKVLTRLQAVKDNCADLEKTATSVKSSEFYRGYDEGVDHAMVVVIEELLE